MIKLSCKLKHTLVCVALVLCSCVVTVGACSYLFKFPSDFWERVLPLPDVVGKSIAVVVEPGLDARRIAQSFKSQDALDGSVWELVYWLKRFGLTRRIRPGLYNVMRSSPWFLARQLRSNKPKPFKFMIVPGVDYLDLQKKVAASLSDARIKSDSVTGYDAFYEAVMNNANYPKEMREKLPASAITRLAFLMPETYELSDSTPQVLVRSASAQWWLKFKSSVTGLTAARLAKLAVIASMVEREVLHDSECRRVAGVIFRRLNQHIALQIDASVIFAHKLAGRRLTRLTKADLMLESPYNTYRNAGLPPTAICIPSVAAWQAAIDPITKDSALYYVARKNGYHLFAPTYQEHLANIKTARAE